MLLPLERVPYEIVDDRVVPTWLTAGDERFVGAVLEGARTLANLSVAEAEEAARTTFGRIAREARMPRRIADALWWVERKRWESVIDAPVSPEALRDTVFELAARLPRDEAVAEAARRFGLARSPAGVVDAIAKQIVVASLFADRASRRTLKAPDDMISPVDAIARFNLAVLQTLVARAMEIDASCAGDPAPIVTAAKRAGLLGSFEEADGMTTIRLGGPLAIFHDTTKYGRSLARFVPSLLVAESWSLACRLDLGHRSARFEIERPRDPSGSAASPPPFSLLPATADGRLARRFRRVLREIGVSVDLQPPVLRSGRALVVADFALEWPGGKVFVDVVPFATPEYLEAKVAAVASLREAVLVCVDERFASRDAPFLFSYRGEVEPWAAFAHARTLVASRGPS